MIQKIRYLILNIIFGIVIQNAFAQNNPYIQAVDEYVPAPGQFINSLPEYTEGDNAMTMAQKATDAIANNANGMISLGGWGGYVTFHFDHPIVNVEGQYDLYIKGNAISGNSEAGIVMVSQDENGDNLPNDTWYELGGSADIDSTNVTYGYELTYAKNGELQDIPWTDNQGNNGVIARNNFHKQEYFPLWLDSTLTFCGTLLPQNCHDTSGNGSYWVLDALRQGYADNLPNNDTIGNSFDINWAVNPVSRHAVSLRSVDFIRVYTALNQSVGWLGETSTEICGAMDLHPDAIASIEKIRIDAKDTYFLYDLFGHKANKNRKGIIIRNKTKYIIINQ